MCTKLASPPPPLPSLSPPPLSSPPPPASVEALVADAEEKTAEAESARDSLLEDIVDERTKLKAELLADAAISGVKVTKVAMALMAEKQYEACAQAFAKMRVAASLCACDASVSTSSRRRLVADAAYDVTVFVSPTTVEETVLAAALESLAAEGIPATTTETDPTEELRALPGIDGSSLESFATAAAAAAQATSAASEAKSRVPTPRSPSFPPAPPPSPPPNLIR
jgi:hypothetical protein